MIREEEIQFGDVFIPQDKTVRVMFVVWTDEMTLHGRGWFGVRLTDKGPSKFDLRASSKRGFDPGTGKPFWARAEE